MIEIDCRGLEFTDFKPDVRFIYLIMRPLLMKFRVIGKPRESSLARLSWASI